MTSRSTIRPSISTGRRSIRGAAPTRPVERSSLIRLRGLRPKLALRRVLPIKLGGNAHTVQEILLVALDDEALGERGIASAQHGQDRGGDQPGALER